tara:strand:- start:2647 stop:3021 length:375 start_codon:yes stop_codon:yes gene_type:complete
MGFFSRLANKVGGAVRFGVKHSESIGRLAHKVSGVASRVGNIAAGVAAGAAGTPFAPIGAVAGGIAGVAKGVGRVAETVGGVADRVSSMKSNFGATNTANAAGAGAVRMLGGRGGGVPQLQLGN